LYALLVFLCSMQMQSTPEFAARMDAADPLHPFRALFHIPQIEGREQIYFLGNSLGLQPKSTKSFLEEVLAQWQQFGVEGFFMGSNPWLYFHDQLVQPLAKIVGAKPSEIVVMNSLTVNLHLLLVSFYRPAGKRVKILCEAKAFPSDQYLLETHVRQRGLNPEDVIIEVAPQTGTSIIATDNILAAIATHGEELALVFWGGVNYYTGQAFDLAAITKAAHAVGAQAGFDLAHATGNIPLQLHNWNVDFAAWCSYKYLNAGPGAVGSCFINERYHNNPELERFAGWWGYKKEDRFLMHKGFVPAASAEGWQLSTPSPLLFAAHAASLQIFEKAGMEAIFSKGKNLSGFLLFLLQAICEEKAGAIQVITPAHAKGCQVSMLIPHNGRQVFDKLTSAGIFADWREPDVIRIAPVPLYNTFSEVYLFAQVLRQALI
jgi:kynureninase